MINVKTFNGFALDFTFPDNMEPGWPLSESVVVTPTTAVVETSSGGRFELFGTEFTYDAETVHATGKVDRVLYFRDGQLMGEATGVDLDADTIFTLAKSFDGGAAVVKYLFQDADSFQLSFGDDEVWNSDGADSIDGGAGHDIVRYFGAKSDYTLSRGENGTIHVKDAAGATDTLINIEQLNFADGVVSPSQIGEPELPYPVMLGGGGGALDGTGGFETVLYRAPASDYDITPSGDTVTVTSGGVIANILTQIERLEFSDAIVALDIDGNAGQAYRLYQAALERTPDNEGLKYWIGRLDSGEADLMALADSFLNSPEFQSKYGTEQTVSDAEFVELLYTHTLGRDYDQNGYAYWVGKLEAGETSRRDLLAQFSESGENKAQVLDAIADGIWLY
jgi:hypothetical protein